MFIFRNMKIKFEKNIQKIMRRSHTSSFNVIGLLYKLFKNWWKEFWLRSMEEGDNNVFGKLRIFDIQTRGMIR